MRIVDVVLTEMLFCLLKWGEGIFSNYTVPPKDSNRTTQLYKGWSQLYHWESLHIMTDVIIVLFKYVK